MKNSKIIASLAMFLMLAGSTGCNSHTHKWGRPTYTWSSDYTSCTATRVCEDNPEHVERETVNSTYTVLTEAQCEIDGEGRFTARFENEEFEIQAYNITVPALEHTWGRISYTWASDYSTCTAMRVCSRDSSHVQSETANSTTVVLSPVTCTQAGSVRYDVTFRNSAFSAQSSPTRTIPASGHDFQFDSFIWDETNYTAQVKYVCSHNAEHFEIHTPIITSSIITEVGCETDGLKRYTATYDGHTDTKDEVLPHTGHDYQFDSFVWDETNYTAQAKYICSHNDAHTLFYDAEVTNTVYQEPKCEVDGIRRYTATYLDNSDIKDVAIPATGHDWGEAEYEWSENYSQCTATIVCKKDPTHIETETVDTVEEVISPATYESGGQSGFTATFTNPLFETQTHTFNTNQLDNLIFTLKNGGTEYSVKAKENTVANEIVIPSTYNSLPVTRIDDNGFSSATCNVKKIVIPTSVTTIEYSSFNGNPHIEEIDGLINMYNGFLSNCSSLKKITFANSFTKVPSVVFKDCPAEEIVVPGAVTVQGNAFKDDEYVKSITLGKNLSSVGDYAFYNTTSLETIYVDPECENFYSDDGILYQKNGSNFTLIAFPICNPTQEYTLLAGTTKITTLTFYKTKYIEELTTNSELATLSPDVFCGSDSLRKVTITNSSVTMNGERIFSDCPNLEEVIFPENANYVCENGLILNKNKTQLLYVLGGYRREITVPNTVYDFKAHYAARIVRCPGFNVEEGSNYFSAENGILMNKDKTQIVRYPYKSSEYVINKDSIPNTVTSLGHYSFGGYTHVSEMDFSETNIEKYLFGAFYINSAVTTIKFPSCVNEFGPYVFSDNSNLTRIEFAMTKQEFLDNVTRTSGWLSNLRQNVDVVFTDEIVEIHTL
ncbi:MAG: leucine-rich repeat protein [Bacilli bacterium]|nr:leucine-rich repeat protein [Bacilli bacterium]